MLRCLFAELRFKPVLNKPSGAGNNSYAFLIILKSMILMSRDALFEFSEVAIILNLFFFFPILFFLTSNLLFSEFCVWLRRSAVYCAVHCLVFFKSCLSQMCTCGGGLASKLMSRIIFPVLQTGQASAS